MSAFDPKRTLRWAKHPRFRTIAPFGDFARTVKHMRFPTQTRESPHFRTSTRAIVKHFWSVLTACSNFTRPRLAWLKRARLGPLRPPVPEPQRRWPSLRRRKRRFSGAKRLAADGAVSGSPEPSAFRQTGH